MAYKTLPKGMDFSTTFDTYIIAYCPDLFGWFVTNKRFFYYEYEKEFQTEKEGIDYFKNNVKKFYEIEIELNGYRPSFCDHTVFLSNCDEIIEVDGVHANEIIDYKYNEDCIYFSTDRDMSVTYYNCSKKISRHEYDGWSMPGDCVGCNEYISREEAMQKLEEIGFRSENKLVR